MPHKLTQVVVAALLCTAVSVHAQKFLPKSIQFKPADPSGPKKTPRAKTKDTAIAATEIYELIFLDRSVIRAMTTAETNGVKRMIHGLAFIR